MSKNFHSEELDQISFKYTWQLDNIILWNLILSQIMTWLVAMYYYSVTPSTSHANNRFLWNCSSDQVVHYEVINLRTFYLFYTPLVKSQKIYLAGLIRKKHTATTTTTKSTEQTTTKNINIIVTKLQYYHLIMHLQFVFDFCSTTLDNKLHTTISNNWLCTTILPDTDLPIAVLTINVSVWYTLN